MALNKTHAMNKERVKAVAIRRDGVVHERGFKSHWQLRAALDPESPHDFTKHIDGDEDGFVTSSGRFVDREEAQTVAIACGQLRGRLGREMLSSDLDW